MKKQIRNSLRRTTQLRLIYSLLYTIFLLYIARATAYITEEVQSGAIKEAIYQLLVLMISWIIYGVFAICLKRKLCTVQTSENFSAKEIVYQRLLQAPWNKAASGGTVLEYVQSDFQRIAAYYSKRLPDILIAGAAVFAWFIYAVCVYWGAAVVMLAFSCIQVTSPLLVKRFLEKQYLDCREKESELTDVILDANAGAEEIKIYQAETWIVKIMEKKHREYKKIGMKSEVAYTQQVMVSSFIQQMITYGFYIVLGVFYFYETITFAQMMLLVVLASDFYKKVNLLFGEIPEISMDQLALERLQQWEQKPDVLQMNKKFVDEKLVENPYWHCRNLYHSYGETAIFADFSADIPLCKKVAVLGVNGSGKSTLLRIFAGIEKPQSGNLYSDMSYFEKLLKAEQIAYLPQNYGEICFSIEELMESSNWEAFLFYADKFEVEKECLEKGMPELSGGQRKKVYLAALFALGKKMILMDEPTNDLDEKGRKTLGKLIAEYAGGVVYVTHDVQLAEMADVKITIEKISDYKGGEAYE